MTSHDDHIIRAYISFSPRVHHSFYTLSHCTVCNFAMPFVHVSVLLLPQNILHHIARVNVQEVLLILFDIKISQLFRRK